MPGAGPGILTTWKPADAPDCGVCAAVDVHYLSTGGARAAAVLAADAAFARMLAERTALYPGCRPAGRASSTSADSRRCARSWRI
jgi:hypothetical protein